MSKSTDSDALLLAFKNQKSRIITENTTAFAMVNLEPLNEFHIMVVPKRKVLNFLEFQPEEAKDFLDLSKQMVDVIQKLSNKDCILFQNYGDHGSIKHIHFHILPSDANLRIMYANQHNVPKAKVASEETMANICNKIKNALNTN